MKKFNSFFLAAAAALVAVTACDPAAVEDAVAKLENMGEAMIEVPAIGGDEIISFKSDAEWSATPSAEWIFIDQTKGAAGTVEVMVSVEPNTTGEERQASVKIEAGKASFSVLVVQSQNDVFSVSAKELSIDEFGGELEIVVNGNVEFTAKSMADWIKVTVTKAVVDTKVVLTVAPNEGAARVGGVKISSSEGDVLVKVSQDCGVNETIGGVEVQYYGHYYDNSTCNWYFVVYSEGALEGGSSQNVYIFDAITSADDDILKYPDGPLEGTWTLDPDETYAPGTLTVNSEVADYIAGEDIFLSDATLTIKDGVFSFEVVTEDGVTYKAKWTIDPEMWLVSDQSYSSTITKDYDVTFSEFEYQSLGQYFLESGIDTYQTMLTLSGGSPQIGEADEAYDTVAELVVSSRTEDFVGEYVVQPSGYGDFSAGTLDGYNSMIYSYTADLYYVEDGSVALASGKMTISRDGDVYTIEGSFKDDYPYGEPHTVTIHYNGTAAAAQSASVKKASSLKKAASLKKGPKGFSNRYQIRF